MNGIEYHIAVSMSGLMSVGMDEDTAFRSIEHSDYCVGADWELVKDHLDDILNNGITKDLPKPTDLPEDLFNV